MIYGYGLIGLWLVLMPVLWRVDGIAKHRALVPILWTKLRTPKFDLAGSLAVSELGDRLMQQRPASTP